MNKKIITIPNEQEEVHTQGFLTIEKDFKSNLNCDFGIQIAKDGRVWICIDGVAFIRFKPHKID